MRHHGHRAAPNRSLQASGDSWTWAVRSYGLPEPYRDRAAREIISKQRAAISPVLRIMDAFYELRRKQIEERLRRLTAEAMQKAVNRLPSGP